MPKFGSKMEKSGRKKMSLAKNGLFFIFLAVLATAGAPGGFKVPMSVYRVDELDKAKTAAQERGKPIALLYSDEHSGCGICVRSSLKIMDELKSRCVLVYIYAHAHLTGLPAPVIQALTAPEGGQTIPKTIVMDSQLEKVLLFIPYAKDEALDEALKKAMKALGPSAPAR